MSGRVSSLYRIPVWNRSGLTLRSVGSGSILLPAHCGLGSMLSANVCAGFFCYCYGELGVQRFLGFVGAPWGLVCMGDAGSAGAFPHIHRAWVTEVCLSLDTLFGRRSAGHYLRDSWGVSWITQKSAFMFRWKGSDSGKICCNMLALVGQPSLRGRDACMVLRVREASWRNCRQKFT